MENFVANFVPADSLASWNQKTFTCTTVTKCKFLYTSTLKKENVVFPEFIV